MKNETFNGGLTPFVEALSVDARHIIIHHTKPSEICEEVRKTLYTIVKDTLANGHEERAYKCEVVFTIYNALEFEFVWYYDDDTIDYSFRSAHPWLEASDEMRRALRARIPDIDTIVDEFEGIVTPKLN